MLLFIVLTTSLIAVFPKKVRAQNLHTVPILMYHYISVNPNPRDLLRSSLSVTPANFKAQMGYLKQQGYTTLTLDDLTNIYYTRGKMPAKPIVLTFDDGYSDFYYNAYPVLKKNKFHAVSFLSTGLIGSNNNIYMNWSQIKYMNKSGLISFEDHSVTHSALTALSTNRLNYELINSKKIIEQNVKRPVRFIAYPFGFSNFTVRNAASRDGYLGGLGTWNGNSNGITMNMLRIRISGGTSLETFVSLVSK